MVLELYDMQNSGESTTSHYVLYDSDTKKGVEWITYSGDSYDSSLAHI